MWNAELHLWVFMSSRPKCRVISEGAKNYDFHPPVSDPGVKPPPSATGSDTPTLQHKRQRHNLYQTFMTRRVSCGPTGANVTFHHFHMSDAVIDRERQLRLYGHVARLPTEDPAYRILYCRDPSGWTMSRWRPHTSWLRQVESYLRDTGMVAMAFAWAMVTRRPWSTVARWTRRALHEVALTRATQNTQNEEIIINKDDKNIINKGRKVERSAEVHIVLTEKS